MKSGNLFGVYRPFVGNFNQWWCVHKRLKHLIRRNSKGRTLVGRKLLIGRVAAACRVVLSLFDYERMEG